MRWHTKQSMFNKAVRGLARQKWESCVNAEGRCRYRYRGKACAIGHLIPDAQYRRSIEGRVPETDATIRVMARVPESLRQFAGKLQSCHDDFAYGDGLRDAFRDFANRHCLVWPKGVK